MHLIYFYNWISKGRETFFLSYLMEHGPASFSYEINDPEKSYNLIGASFFYLLLYLLPLFFLIGYLRSSRMLTWIDRKTKTFNKEFKGQKLSVPFENIRISSQVIPTGNGIASAVLSFTAVTKEPLGPTVGVLGEPPHEGSTESAEPHYQMIMAQFPIKNHLGAQDISDFLDDYLSTDTPVAVLNSKIRRRIEEWS